MADETKPSTNDPSPPEIEAELISSGGMDETPAAGQTIADAQAPPPAPRTKVPMAAIGAGLAAIVAAAGALFIFKPWATSPIPNETAPSAKEATITATSTSGNETPASDMAAPSTSKIETIAPETSDGANVAATPQAVDPSRDAVLSGGQTTNEIASEATAGAGEAVTTAPASESAAKTATGDETVQTQPEATTATAPSEEPSDVLAQLEADAAAREAAEAAGAVAGAPPPTEIATGPPAGGEPIDAANSAPAPAPAAPATNNPSTEVSALKELFQSETSRLSAALDAERSRAAEQSAEIAALRAQLEAARAAAAPAPQRRVADPGSAVLVMLALSRAIDDGRPFKIELARLETFAGGSPAIERLRPIAEAGAPTRAALKERFPDLARRALAADARANAKGPFGAIVAGFARLVTVMPAKPAPGAGTPAILSRAKGRLDADDVAGAVEELNALVGAAHETFGPWLADGARYVEARAAIAALNAELLDGAQTGARGDAP